MNDVYHVVGYYLVCDPYTGWSIRVLDDHGNTREILVLDCPTMEETIRQAVITLNKAVAIKLSPGGPF